MKQLLLNGIQLIFFRLILVTIERKFKNYWCSGGFQSTRKNKSVFLENGKLVKYEKFPAVEDYGVSLFPWDLPYINVDINFLTDKYTLERLNYSGNLDQVRLFNSKTDNN